MWHFCVNVCVCVGEKTEFYMTSGNDSYFPQLLFFSPNPYIIVCVRARAKCLIVMHYLSLRSLIKNTGVGGLKSPSPH